MSITECPHCHRRVVPSASGECPSCGLNVADEDALGKKMRLLVVRRGQSFPNICFNCAEPALKLVKVKISNVDAGVTVGRILFSMVMPFARLLSAFEAAKTDIFMTLKVPICDTCRKRKIRPEIQAYDLEAKEMRVVVHEQFRDSTLGK